MTDINNIKTVCSFYASEWHLLTMLLPNIDKKINKGIKITTVLEKNLQNNMETLLKKLKLENESKILNIGWNENELNPNRIKDLVKNNEYIIVAGTVEYINEAHLLIKEYASKNQVLTVLDCYDINECESGIKQILDMHEKVLNTAGERNIEEYVTTIKMAN